jgi:hypothetical protein
MGLEDGQCTLAGKRGFKMALALDHYPADIASEQVRRRALVDPTGRHRRVGRYDDASAKLYKSLRNSR